MPSHQQKKVNQGGKTFSGIHKKVSRNKSAIGIYAKVPPKLQYSLVANKVSPIPFPSLEPLDLCEEPELPPPETQERGFLGRLLSKFM